MSFDFQILSVSILEGVFKHRDKPCFQVIVHSNHSQLDYAFDDRWGSWQTAKSDDAGNRKEPSSALAAAMTHAVDQAVRRGELLVPSEAAPADINPFVDPTPALPPPPPIPAELADNPFVTAPDDEPEIDLSHNPFL